LNADGNSLLWRIERRLYADYGEALADTNRGDELLIILRAIHTVTDLRFAGRMCDGCRTGRFQSAALRGAA
jgi:hypothetical protein